MKLKILQILLFSAVFILMTSSLTFAQQSAIPAEETSPSTPAVSSQQTPGLEPNFLPILANPSQASKVNLVANLPKGDWTTVIGNVIKLVLAVTGSLAFASFTWGGIILVTAQGDETKFKKGKDILYMSVLALIIIAVSYAIVLGITQLKFFQ